MIYYKKTCILREIKQGFSGDGKTLSGLVKIEQYGKNLSIEVSVINFAPLVAGEYYCLLTDPFSHVELLPLRGKSFFNVVSSLDISLGFCGVICFVKNEVLPIAYGVNGEKTYDWKSLLATAFPTPAPKSVTPRSEASSAESKENPPKKDFATNFFDEEDDPTDSFYDELDWDVPIDEEEETDDPAPDFSRTESSTEDFSNPPDDLPPPIREVSEKDKKYDDEMVAVKNYYRAEENDEYELLHESSEDAQTKSEDQIECGEAGQDVAEDVDAESVLHPFEIDPDGYYRSVKAEIDELFEKYPKDDTLNGVFSCSEWVRLKGEEGSPEYLVGIVYENWKAKYVCYALPADDRDSPPEEIKDVCTFVPTSLYSDTVGFFVIFQSAASGECIRPESV
jgi:hypothetical protein